MASVRATDMRSRYAVLSALCLSAFGFWFLDGFYQPINADTYIETFNEGAIDYRWPQGLWGHTEHRARWLADIFPYVTFHTIGIIHSLMGDHGRLLWAFVAQGIMTGAVYLLFIGVSAYYISLGSKVASWRYLLSFFLMLTVTLGIQSRPMEYSKVVLMTFRFYHPSVMIHYVWTISALLFCFLPYWRWFTASRWEDWYDNIALRSLWYFLIICTAFSSTGTTVLAVTAAALLLIGFLFQGRRAARHEVSCVPFPVDSSWRHRPLEKVGGLVLFMVCGAVALLAEAQSTRADAMSAARQARFGAWFDFWSWYLSVWWQWLGALSRAIPSLVGLATVGVAAIAYRRSRNLVIRREMDFVLRAACFLALTMIVYSLLMGSQAPVSYRFRESNLAPDTMLPVTWFIVFTILSVWTTLWSHKRFTALLPFVLLVAVSYLLYALDTRPFYDRRQAQLQAFEVIGELNCYQVDDPMLISESMYHRLLPWGYGMDRLEGFVYHTLKLVDRKYHLKVLSDGEFEHYYREARQRSLQSPLRKCR